MPTQETVSLSPGKNHAWLQDCPDQLLNREPNREYLALPANFLATATLELKEGSFPSKSKKPSKEFDVKFIRPAEKGGSDATYSLALAKVGTQKLVQSLFKTAFAYANEAEANAMRRDVEEDSTVAVMDSNCIVCAVTYAMTREVIVLKHLAVDRNFQNVANQNDWTRRGWGLFLVRACVLDFQSVHGRSMDSLPTCILAQCNPANTLGEGFYKKHGFKRVNNADESFLLQLDTSVAEVLQSNTRVTLHLPPLDAHLNTHCLELQGDNWETIGMCFSEPKLIEQVGVAAESLLAIGDPVMHAKVNNDASQQTDSEQVESTANDDILVVGNTDPYNWMKDGGVQIDYKESIKLRMTSSKDSVIDPNSCWAFFFRFLSLPANSIKRFKRLGVCSH